VPPYGVPVPAVSAYTCVMEHEERLPAPAERLRLERRQLHHQWRRLGWVATLVAVLTSPALYMWFRDQQHWTWYWCLLATFLSVIAFRGLVDLGSRWLIPAPSLSIDDSDAAKQKDAVSRRRVSFWRFWFRLAVFLALLTTVIWIARLLTAAPGESPGWVGSFTLIFSTIAGFGPFALILPLYFLLNFAILFGPLMLMGITQIKAYEPGDADWGVKLEDVRGQAEAKEEVRRVVTLWQSGELFEKAGGKRERGLLMLGAPGTGKTMLSKGIATGFNCPFISIPGSGFAQTFIGMDAVIVRYLAWRAKRLARKWGGQCIVFIDEIDAVGMRRASLGPGGRSQPSIHDVCFFGPHGALNPSGELILETREWRERLFASRATPAPSPYPAVVDRLTGIVNQMMPGGMFGGGQLALNQLLVVMDGIGDPPFMRRFFTNRFNTFLDACYIVPQRIKAVPLRLPRPRPRKEQIYFIGACNVPIESLDPALTRPGRLGRHVWFRTPNKNDRKDIFDLYMGKVDHDADLNSEESLDELARMTPGYSPAMIEQVCSMALTRAHYDGRLEFERDDIIESMTTIESGMAIDVEVLPEESRAVAVHEAGHAIASHVYMEGLQSTRLSIRHRGSSLGHHSARQTEERFSSWHHEESAQLVWGLGAMAAERAFYGENSVGVGGDVYMITAQAAMMVGRAAMPPPRVDLTGRFRTLSEEDEAREQIMERFEKLGTQIMNRASIGGGPYAPDPIASVMGDRDKRRMMAQIIGHAFVTAYALVQANREAVDHIAEVLVQRREFYGDEVVQLLDDAKLTKPHIDWLDEKTWPTV
jgi:cell division protease FtsH